jgi:tetratricopeptide (TPR) repeat protein
LPLKNYTFFNLYIGNVHDTSGTDIIDMPSNQALMSRGDINQIDFLEELRKDIASYPLQLARNLLKKTVLFLSNKEVPNNISYQLAKEWNGFSGLFFLNYALVLGLGVVGMVAAWQEKRGCLLLYLFYGVFAVSLILIHILTRLRLPSVSLLIIFAGWGLYCLYHWIKASLPKRWLGAVGLSLGVGAFSLFFPTKAAEIRPGDIKALSMSLYNRGIDHYRHGELLCGRRYFVKSWVLSDFRNSHAAGRIEEINQLWGQGRDKRRELHAAELLEKSRQALLHKDLTSAIALTKEAVARAPFYPPSYHSLADLYHLAHNPTLAFRYLVRALELAPEDPVLQNNIRSFRGRYVELLRED